MKRGMKVPKRWMVAALLVVVFSLCLHTGQSTAGPTYGGALNLVHSSQPNVFDPVFGWDALAYPACLTNEDLIEGDWAKGPAGTGEAAWIHMFMPAANVQTGCLAESWELPGPNTLVYHIRKGVRFHDKPPTGGRELDAEDVAFNLKRYWGTDKCAHKMGYPFVEKITALDKWTVEIKSVPGKMGPVYEFASTRSKMFPKDMIEKFGDMSDWRNSCGTGPFVLKDYVEGGSLTFERFAGYWKKDPFRPENRLPYVDTVKLLIIPDLSTRMAAMRTGRADVLPYLSWEDAESLQKTSPQLKWINFLSGGLSTIAWRVDRPDLPFHDVRVRQALHLSLDHAAIAKHFYGGNAEVFAWPVNPSPDWMDMYTPLDALPPPLKELYEYHPEKAGKLLAEAGYPNGFKTVVDTVQSYVDLLSIVKNQWERVGVHLEIRVLEQGAYQAMQGGKTHEQLYIYPLNANIPFRMMDLVPGNIRNMCMVDDPRINKAFDEITAGYFDEPGRRRLYKDLSPYLIEQCYLLALPLEKQFTFWQPWLQGYHGEMVVGHAGFWWRFANYVWIDKQQGQ